MDKTDLDETRRLLYMALAATRTKKYELVGTLANALLHHSALEIGEPDDLVDRLVDAVDDVHADRGWVLDLIDSLTESLATPS
jgi:hypothetical protein